MLAAFEALPLVWMGALASLGAGIATGLGALPVLFITTVSRRVQDVLLGLAAGIMLAATVFALVLPGLEIAIFRTESPVGGTLQIGIGILLGAMLLWTLNRFVPHEHPVKGAEGPSPRAVRRIWLFVLAITLHNVPEGLAVGVAVGSGEVANALSLTLGIFLQNLPEGFIIALALLPLGYSRLAAVLIALGTGAVETVGGLFGALAVTLSSALLPWALAAAAGAMLFVISHEVIPETHEHGQETPATFGIIAGFVLMMLLDAALEPI
jgi:zinc transporter, ZIP family